MFTEQHPVFIHCVSPVHMGSGTALGVIDNPIQRERHTSFPLFAGAGLKGALRHHLAGQLGADHADLNAVFGPASERGEKDLFAGAVSFTDAQLVLFPVRSARNGFAYATCPLALAAARRLLAATGDPGWTVPDVADNNAVCATESLLSGKDLLLELFAFPAQLSAALAAIAADLARHFPPGNAWQFFRDKVARDLVLLSDTDFTYFVRNATVVEPHVRINDDTGAADDDGGLFYTENLPPESVLLSLLLAGPVRGGQSGLRDADQVGSFVRKHLPPLLQIGGDGSTGRGQVVFRFAQGGAQ